MTAGYSGTPQARKLGLKAGQRVARAELTAQHDAYLGKQAVRHITRLVRR